MRDKKDYPSRGWRPVGIIKHDSPVACERCGRETKYVHVLAYRTGLRLKVGVICAEHLTIGWPGERPAILEAKFVRKESFIGSPEWRETARGNARRSYKGHLIVVFKTRFSSWGAFVDNKRIERGPWPTFRAAAEAVFDALAA